MRRVYFLHGFLGDASDAEPLESALQQHRGFSDFQFTSIPLPVATDWQSGVDAIRTQMAPNSDLVGYSMGARLALAVTLENPQFVRSLAFISGNPGLDEGERSGRLAHDQRWCERLLSEPIDSFLNDWYQQSVFQRMQPAVRSEAIARRSQQLSTHDAKQRQVGLMKCYSVASQPNYWKQLEQCTCRVMAIAGERDSKYVTICQKIQLANERIQLTVIPHAAHSLVAESPAELATTLIRFWGSVD
ncbi:MAG: alpha/beta fold hydrolase [Pirellulaceae bacterium]